MRADRARHPLWVVVDTNVWISAALSASGAPALAARRVLETRRPVFSEGTFAELETRLWRPKFDRYLSIDLRQRILHDLSAAADWVVIPSDLTQQTWSRDPDDDHFVRAALAAQAPLLITGDADLLDLPAIAGLRILTPADGLGEWDGAATR